jgi:hypothetical protein
MKVQMKQYKPTPVANVIPKNLGFRNAKIVKQFENIQVVDGSEEVIFNEVYVTAILSNDRICKFRKSTLEFV